MLDVVFSYATAHKTQLSVFIVWLFILSALIGMALGFDAWFIEKTPLNLLIGAGLLVWNFPIDDRRKIAFGLFAFAVGMVVEIIGVRTGALFGTYYYGSNLGPKFMEVPYLIGVYWSVLSFICAAIGKRIAPNLFVAALLGAAFMVGLDGFMEQLAVRFDFWHFEGGLAPFQNYVTWYVVAFGLQYILLRTSEVKEFWFSLNLYASQVVFFAVSMWLFL